MSEILVNTIKKADGTGSITVPADSGTLLTSVSSIPVANLDSAVGITMLDSWRLHTGVSCASNTEVFITSNLERNDNTTAGFIGTGMTESSGVFTFPSTGIYQIFHIQTYYGVNTGVRAIENTIQLSTNSGSSYSIIGLSYGSIANKAPSDSNFGQVITNTYIDVTDTSTFRVRFRARSYDDTTTLAGTTGADQTVMQFVRLGDT